MGERGGFLKYKRIVPSQICVSERIAYWDEFAIRQPEEEIKSQAARCMECGTPFCHTGDYIGNAISGCPANNLIPEWNDLIYRGLWKEAYERLIKKTDFPEFTGRVCPALCEGSCTAGLYNDPVTIKNIEKEIIERAFENGWIKPQIPRSRTGKKAAVVGSGPAGLALAYKLNREGHHVSVFERDDRPGGLLMYGIPNMKLDKKKVVMRRVDLLAAEGIEFVLNTDVGKDIGLDDMIKEYDAVALCTGSTVPRDLNVSGRELDGIYFAVDYLKQSTRGILSHKKPGISAKDKDVVIIGGGDTGTDCVATGIRQRAKSVTQLEIMPRPFPFRQIDNPWPEWPKIEKVDYGQEEAISLYGEDPRKYLTTVTSIIPDQNGHVRAVQTADVSWIKDGSGRRVPALVKDSESVIRADMVLIAMGFTGTEDYCFTEVGVKKETRGSIYTDPGSFSTNIDKVFTAGDARRGQSLVIWAMSEGKRAADEINQYLIRSI